MERLLRLATWVSAGLLFTGLMAWLAGAAAAPVVLHLGLLLLMATPVVRVVMALAEYVKAGDWVFAALTAIVLACLALPAARYFLASLR